MNLKEKFVLLCCIGFSMGLLIDVFVYAYAVPIEQIIEEKGLMPVQFIGSGINGAICFGGTIVYEIEKWGLLHATLTHFLLTLASFLTANAVLQWFPNSIMVFVMILFVIGYFIIWLVMYLGWKRQVKKLNQELEEMKLSDRLTD